MGVPWVAHGLSVARCAIRFAVETNASARSPTGCPWHGVQSVSPWRQMRPPDHNVSVRLNKYSKKHHEHLLQCKHAIPRLALLLI